MALAATADAAQDGIITFDTKVGIHAIAADGGGRRTLIPK